MARRVFGWSLIVALTAAGAASYLIPFSSQTKDAQRGVTATFAQTEVFEGTGPQHRNYTYPFEVPGIDERGPHAGRLGLRFRIESTQPAPDDLILETTLKLDGESGPFYRLFSNAGKGTKLEKTVFQSVPTWHCPCESREGSFLVSLSQRFGNESYAYRLTPIFADFTWQSLDTNGDLIVDADQWVPQVPQFVFPFIAATALLPTYNWAVRERHPLFPFVG